MKRLWLNLLLLMAITALTLANIYVLAGAKQALPQLPKQARPSGLPPPVSVRATATNLSGLRDGFSVPKPTLPPSSSALLGVVLHGDRRFAIVQKSEGNSDVLEEGSELDNMRIKRIAPQGLILEGSGHERVKIFPKDE